MSSVSEMNATPVRRFERRVTGLVCLSGRIQNAFLAPFPKGVVPPFCHQKYRDRILGRESGRYRSKTRSKKCENSVPQGSPSGIPGIPRILDSGPGCHYPAVDCHDRAGGSVPLSFFEGDYTECPKSYARSEIARNWNPQRAGTCPAVRIRSGPIGLSLDLKVAHLKIMFDLSTKVRDHVQEVVEVVDDSL